MNRAHTIWTRPIRPRLRIEEVPHIDYDTDLLADNRWVLSSGTGTNGFIMRQHGSMYVSTYVANGRVSIPTH